MQKNISIVQSVTGENEAVKRKWSIVVNCPRVPEIS